MQITEAVSLIRCPLLETRQEPATWADLGCGSGLFTRALGSLLPAGSTVFGIDKTNQLLQDASVKNMHYPFVQADFLTDTLALPPLDGILMANALHYVPDKDAFLEKILAYCQPDAGFLIIEYDTDKAVRPWVPYPINFSLLSALFRAHGYTRISKLGEHPSLYRNGSMYSALLIP